MTPEEYDIALAKFKEDLAKWNIESIEWHKKQKAYIESLKPFQKRLPNPGPAPRPPSPPPYDWSKVLPSGKYTPPKPNPTPPPSGMPRPI